MLLWKVKQNDVRINLEYVWNKNYVIIMDAISIYPFVSADEKKDENRSRTRPSAACKRWFSGDPRIYRAALRPATSMNNKLKIFFDIIDTSGFLGDLCSGENWNPFIKTYIREHVPPVTLNNTLLVATMLRELSYFAFY